MGGLYPCYWPKLLSLPFLGHRIVSFTFPIHLLGLTVSGDVGPFTVYTDRFGKKVFFPKAPPKSPASDLQLLVRSRFMLAQTEYMSLSDADKLAYENLVRATNLCMTGQNLFIHVAMMHTFTFLDTLQRQAGIAVPAPSPV